MQQLNLISGKTKEEIAIDFIRQYEPPEGYFFGDSGGKDSTALRGLIIESGVKYKGYYSATGIDPPEVVQFIKKYHQETIIKRPYLTMPKKYPEWKGTRSFFEMLQIKGFPMRFARWCCDDLKKNPTRNIPLNHRLLGLRTEESSMRRLRKDNPEKFKKWMIYKPIFHWLEWEIWDYIENNNLPYCSLYDEGFDRIGCVVCPFLCHGENNPKLVMHMERWPKIYFAFEKAMKKLFDNYLCHVNPRSGAVNFRRETDFDEFLQNWYLGK